MSRSNIIALAITILFAAVYGACYLVPAPHAPIFHLMTLGLKPMFGAFMIIELLSCVLPPLTRFRRQGVSGRRRLNLMAISLALLIATLQGYAGSNYLLANPDSQVTLPGDDVYSSAAETQFTLMVIGTLLGGTVLATGLAYGITRLGVANGFSVLMLGEFFWAEFSAALDSKAGAIDEISPREFDLARLLLLVSMLAVGVWFLRVPRRFRVRRSDAVVAELPLPPFPQGVVPLGLTHLISLWMAAYVWGPTSIGSWPHMIVLAFAAVPMLSWILYRWFSSPNRIATGFAGRIRLDPSAEADLSRQFKVATGLLVTVPLLLAFVYSFTRVQSTQSVSAEWLVTTATMLAGCALMLDTFNLWMFRQQVSTSVRIADLDNVHVAGYAMDLLKRNDIDVCLQGFHHRRLLFHFGAAIKIGLYVPVSKADLARQLLKAEELHIV